MRMLMGSLGALALLLSSGCSSLQYMETSELWANADSNFDSGAYDDAIPYYDEIISRNKGESRAYLFRGVSRERDGDPRGALRDYSRAGDLGETRGLLYRANLNIQRNDVAGGESDLAQLQGAGLSGRDRVVQLTLLGTLRLQQNKPRMAVQNFERAIAEGASSSDFGTRRHVASSHHNAAQAYYLMGDFERAYDHFEKYMASGEGGSDSDHYMYGLLAYLVGDYDTSDEQLAKADPSMVSEGAEILDDPSFGASR